MKFCLPFATGLLLVAAGCASPAIRSQSPDDVTSMEAKVKLVGDVARPFGTRSIRIQGIGLVTGLNGTGSDPAPSPERTALLEDMYARGVVNPNKVLSSTNTALVIVTGLIPPGAQKGDIIDIEIKVPPQSETTSLRGGWLLRTRLQEMLIVENRIREGSVMAEAEGSLLVEPATGDDGTDASIVKRAKILGGAVIKNERQFGLGLARDEDLSLAARVRVSSQAGAALNKRFHRIVRGDREGVANPKNDGFIELSMHPRYKDNVARYLRVVRAVPINERPSEQLARLELLERQLLNPITSGNAAIRLEAIGKPAIKVLEAGLKSDDPEVKFYSAEALAYMDEPSAAPALGEAARNEPAFRAFALAALSTLNDIEAEEQLLELLHVESSETRYGAFRALRAMNERNAAIRGENLNGKFSYHLVKSNGAPMVHVTRHKRPEIVLFGSGHHLRPPLLLNAGNSITITSTQDNQIAVSRFAVGQPDQKRVVSPNLDEVIRAIVDVGGTYPDVVDALQQAKLKKVLSCRFEVEAIAEFGRQYDRQQSGDGDEDDLENEEKPKYIVAGPLPSLFSNKSAK